MDAISALEDEDDPRPIVWMKSSQVGATEIMCNVSGYFMDHDPAPQLVVQATLDNASAWSKERLATMIAASPSLRAKVSDVRAKDSSNTIHQKMYPGGVITLVAANSPAGLRMRPIRVLNLDDISAFPASAGAEGDPVKLAIGRTKTYQNRVIFMASKPTIKGVDRCEHYYDQSTKNRFMVPCPKCGEAQALDWERVRWEKNKPETARYHCGACRHGFTEAERIASLAWGRWQEQNPGAAYIGFHISALYSPWESIPGIARRYLEALDSPELLKTWTNEDLGLPYEIDTEAIDWENLYATRRERYDAEIPAKAVILVGGADVQKDRIELELVAFDEHGESWSIAYHIVWGDVRYKDVWREFDEVLRSEFRHESGQTMTIAAVGVDSGAYTDEVYKFCRGKFGRRILALKGKAGQGPVVANLSRKNKYKVRVYTIHVDPLKERLFDRLARVRPGPGYCHFPIEYNELYFEQLTAEAPEIRYRLGQPYIAWKRLRERNEPLDCRIYATAALSIYDPDRRWNRLKGRYTETEAENPTNQVTPMSLRRRRRAAPKKNWTRGWRR